MSADVARGHGDDGGGDNRPPPHQIGGGFQGTLMPLGDHEAHWANLLEEIVREFSMHYRSWHNILAEKKVGVLGKIRSQFDLRPHMQSDLENWIKINTGIQQHLEKIYTDNKSALKAEHWVPNPEDETYGVENIRSRRSANTSQGSRSLAALRDMQMQSSDTREYPSLIQTYFQTHNVDGVFLREKELLLYEMLRLQGLGSNTPIGVPYTDDEIMTIVRGGKQRGHILGVGRVLARQGMDVIILPEPRCTHTADVDELKKINKQLKKQMDMIMKVFRSDDKMSQFLTQIQLQLEVGSGSGSGGAGDMSRAMMRMPARMRNMRIVRRCYIMVNKDLLSSNLFLASLPLYYMSSFKVSKGVLSKMESIRRNFFNGVENAEKKMSLIGWNKILASKKVENGEATSFWNDVWLGDFPLKQTYPRLYFLELDKYVSVASQVESYFSY
ncbi:hypothetical protein Tco_1273860 [Tanacetum coccineum]